MPADFYNDPKFSYPGYWQSRQYEHASEILALAGLIGTRHFSHIVDLGGGYGRLVPTLLKYSDRITLVEPSSKQRRLARNFLPKDPRVAISPGTGQSSVLPVSCSDLVILIRVAHHLVDLAPLFAEVNRILTPQGLLILEFANSLNIKARWHALTQRLTISKYPLDMRSPQHQNPQTIPFLNHHPETILKTLHLCRFEPLKLLSVSNFRSPFLKRTFPIQVLLFLEKISQSPLARLYFGPSIFVLAQKVDNLSIP